MNNTLKKHTLKKKRL